MQVDMEDCNDEVHRRAGSGSKVEEEEGWEGEEEEKEETSGGSHACQGGKVRTGILTKAEIFRLSDK